MLLRVIVGVDSLEQHEFSETTTGDFSDEFFEYEYIDKFRENPNMIRVDIYKHEGSSFELEKTITREQAIQLYDSMKG
ncbi:hypothetical protein COF68_05465 [Bacillus toyonensis]|uniref:hypothetical protein n=1 Tax=Bacillus toyonensis TaxID=155322 RepID=UPI000BFC2088|nr:hypothetical protein [Bacillus toyonensis]PHE64291.1 hypothetical protein COF68_05465 [Bacillus toyonensis]